jgi:hypothetical protein
MLKEALEKFAQPVYVRTKRNTESYAATAAYVTNNLTRLVYLYHSTKNDEQTYRLIRDDIDNALRRYHGYCIKENFGAHYVEVGLEGNGIFEHMIPNSTVRDLLIAGVITPRQACNMPTARISVEKDVLLREKGWASRTPDIYNFWKRYEYCFDVTNLFETYDGILVNPAMTLDNHFERFYNV